LERSDRLRANCTFKLSSVGLKLPAADRPEPVDKLIQEVADGITAMTVAALQRTQPPSN
jgi:hypothetical protein